MNIDTDFSSLDEDNVASKELSTLYKNSGVQALELTNAIEEKYQPKQI